MINTRAKMRRSNKRAKDYLLSVGYDFVYLQQHTRWDTFTYFQNSTIRSKDIAGVFDGFAINDGDVFFLQVKTNSWAGWKKFREFCEKYDLNALMFNVKDGGEIFKRTLLSIDIKR